jgi:hypothetical protein
MLRDGTNRTKDVLRFWHQRLCRTMVNLVFALGALMIVWGLFILATGDYVATLDIAAGVIGTGVVVIALGAIIKSIDSLRRALPLRWDAAMPAIPAAAAVDERRPEPVLSPAPVSPRPEPEVAAPAMTVATVSTAVREEVVVAAPAPEAASFPPPSPREPTSAPKAEAAPVLETPEEPETQAPQRSLVREGEIDGRVYRFYSDGSIEAEDDEGVQHYASMAEAREHIIRVREERIRAEQAQSVPPAPRDHVEPKSPGSQSVQEPSTERPVRVENAPAGTRNAEERSANWQNYLSNGRTVAPEVRVPPQGGGGARAESAPPVVGPFPASATRQDPGEPPTVPAAPRPSERLSASDQNWSDSFRQLLKKSSGPQGGGETS